MVSKDELNLVRKHMSAVRAPAHYDRVFKDECQFSFDTALSPSGLYINMHSWQAFGHDFVEIDSRKSGQQLYLHELWDKVLSLVLLARPKSGLDSFLIPTDLTPPTGCRYRCQLRTRRSKSKHQRSWPLVGTVAFKWTALHTTLKSTLSSYCSQQVSRFRCLALTFQS